MKPKKCASSNRRITVMNKFSEFVGIEPFQRMNVTMMPNDMNQNFGILVEMPHLGLLAHKISLIFKQ